MGLSYRRLTPTKREEYHTHVDFKHPYLTQQIIAYIGNKRRLLPLIHRAMQQIYSDTIPQGLKFADPFAGSGVVSRLAKFLGFQVISNDWEPYAFTLGKAYLEINASDIETLFGSVQELERLLNHLNTLPDPPIEEQYIARYYAPTLEDPEKADYRKERLFYTRDNALRIDRIRNEIDRLYPPLLSTRESIDGSNPREAEVKYRRTSLQLGESIHADRCSRCRNLLISLLLYEAATHTNTSGVFKAFHRGFGGHGKDALGRILRPIQLEPPPLIDSPHFCRMYGEDATSLFRSLGQSFDLVYLDPPYNQHQYGSNYHLLNTIVLWDKVPMPLELGSDGRLRDKAGIRKDWKRTKSAYCYRDTAIEAFSALLQAIDAEHVIISYSTDGIIPFETLRDLCAARGEVYILTNEYITYRGGKQSNLRQDRNIEFVLWIRAGRKRRVASPYPARTKEPISPITADDTGELDRVLIVHRIRLLLRRIYKVEAVRATFEVQPEGSDRYRVQIPLRTTNLFITFRYLLEPVYPVDLHPLSMEDLKLLEEKLQAIVCVTRKEELDALLTVLPETMGRDRTLYQKKILTILRKLAHRKYQSLFWEACEKVRQILSSMAQSSEGDVSISTPPEPKWDCESAQIPLFEVKKVKAKKARIDGKFHWEEELNKIQKVAELRFSDRQQGIK